MQISSSTPAIRPQPQLALPPQAKASEEDTQAPVTDHVVLSRDRPAAVRTRVKSEDQLRLGWQASQGAVPLFGLGGLIFPDSQGQIKHMALQLGNVEFNQPLPAETQQGLMGVWGQLFRHMSPETHFTVVCADANGVEAVENLVENSAIDSKRVTIVGAESEKGMSIWIRDSMLPVRDGQSGQSKLLIQDRTYWPGPEDNRVAPLLDAAHESISSQDHPALRIDGGNVLSNSHHCIVGNDSITHTRERLQELAQDTKKREAIEAFYSQASGKPPGEDMWQELPKLVFESEFQRPVLVVAREREQPAFHIDMTMTPIGDSKFLVGDPGMAIAQLRNLSPSEKAEVNRSMALQAGITSGEDLVEKLIAANSEPAKQADYDATARELSEAGYEIERIPALMGLRTTWSVPYLTYNNCIMENYTNPQGEDVKKVYLPQYGCAPLDQMAQEIYERNGFEIVPLEMGAISKLEGAIRCSSYAIDRDF